MDEASDKQKAEYEGFDSERRFLEKLFIDRFNYYSLFAAGFFFVIFKSDISRVFKIITLCFGSLIFLLMFLSLLRTNRIINKILDKLTKEYKGYPYSIIMKELRTTPSWHLPYRSNKYLLLVSFALFVLMLLITILYCIYPEILQLGEGIR